MPSLRRLLLLGLLGLVPSAPAEDPGLLGLKKAAVGFQSVPAETSAKAIQTANDHLAPHFKPYGTNHSAAPNGGTRKWVELQGLGFSHVRYDALSDADRANGIEIRLHLKVVVNRYRYLESSSTWGPWRNGRPMGVPAVVYVEKRDSQWGARSSVATFLRPINDGQLRLSLNTPSNPQIALPTPPPPATARQSTPVRENPLGSRTPKPTTQPTSANPDLTTGTKQITHSFLTALLPLFLILGGTLIITLFFTVFRSRRRTPPRVPRTTSTPPPLPPTRGTTSPEPLELFSRRETLMTPAEQKFHAVLEPLVSAHYLIATKVRLADLFDALYAPGHQAAFNKIRSKHIDFVLTEPGNSRILCGIELDDRSHQRPDRIERDAFVDQLFESQRLPLLRVPCARSYQPESLRKSLSDLIGEPVAA